MFLRLNRLVARKNSSPLPDEKFLSPIDVLKADYQCIKRLFSICAQIHWKNDNLTSDYRTQVSDVALRKRHRFFLHIDSMVGSVISVLTKVICLQSKPSKTFQLIHGVLDNRLMEFLYPIKHPPLQVLSQQAVSDLKKIFIKYSPRSIYVLENLNVSKEALTEIKAIQDKIKNQLGPVVN